MPSSCTMFYQSAERISLQNKNKSYRFKMKGRNNDCEIELVINPSHIDRNQARTTIVESFTVEYQKQLKPHQISSHLTSWRTGNQSVQKYYKNYFATELEDLYYGDIHYWLQAKVAGVVVGVATFMREKKDQKAVYMNLLAVHPNFQGAGIGEHLVNGLMYLGVIPDLHAIHILIRKLNEGGKIFYKKLGFYSDPDYRRDNNFVDLELLEGMTWKNPVILNQQNENYCGFQSKFLIGKRF